MVTAAKKIDSPGMENRIARVLLLCVSISVLIISLGICTAYCTGTAYWVDRSGKVVVAFSLLLTFIQFQYEGRFSHQINEFVTSGKNSALEKGMSIDEAERYFEKVLTSKKSEFESSRRTILLYALSVAAIGELVSAFGGFLFSIITR